MTNTDYFETSKWASEVADRYNKSITYILMKIHEGQTKHQQMDEIKSYVLSEVGEAIN